MTRVEDGRLLRGAGRFVDDLAPEGVRHAVAVRSPHAHARILRVDVEVARAMPGVDAVVTAADLDAAGVGGIPLMVLLTNADGTAMAAPVRPLLASTVTRHVGDAVAFVVAESRSVALDAAEAVVVDYEALTAAIGATAALAEGAPLVWPDAPGNLSFDWEGGSRSAAATAMEQAARIVTLTAPVPRVIVSPMEPRGAVGWYDAATETYTLSTPSQGVHPIRDAIAGPVLGVAPERLRVVSQDVGGGFGIRLPATPEQALVLVAARRVGRPVKWVAGRDEAFLTDPQSRDHRATCRLALDEDGRFLGLAVDSVADLGAYLSPFATVSPGPGFAKVMGGPYRIPAIHVRVRGAFTHTTPTDAYRGAGKPEATYLLERLIDRAARETGIDRVALRRRNLVPADALPYRTAVGETFEAVDFPAVLDAALRVSDWDGFDRRRRASATRGRRRGRGIGLYVHATGGFTTETSRVSIDADGLVWVETGTQSSGQGHETALARLAADRLELPVERIRVAQGDSAALPRGGGTGGSSSLTIGATTIDRAAVGLIEQARPLAADRLEVAMADLEYVGGRFVVAGTDRAVDLVTIAAGAWHGPPPQGAAAAAAEGGCVGSADFAGEKASYPNGAYVAETEVDPDTGRVTLDRFVAVDDLGRRVDPVIVEGQLHGGIAQAVGEALLEAAHHDTGGQLVSGSYMDYAMPRADDLPRFVLAASDRPSGNNGLGVKGAGEVATIGGIAPVANAVADALDCDEIDIPATPEAVWRALRG